MEALHILLLGTPMVQQGGTPVQIKRRLLRALLYYLAACGEPVSRTTLITLFWPDKDESTARGYLRDSLNKLKNELPDPAVIIASREHVTLDAQRVEVDAIRFQQIFHQSMTMLRHFVPGPLPANLVQMLTEGVHVWRSPHFLSGLDLPGGTELDEWVLMTSQKFEQARETLVRYLADHYRISGDYENALQWLYIAAEAKDLNEDTDYHIIDLLIKSGRRGEAIHYWNNLRSLYRREYDAEPPHSLQVMIDHLQPPDTHQPTQAESFWPVALTTQVPLVGRQPWLNLLNMIYARGGIALITGESGIGKTRLVKEFYQSLSPSPWLILALAQPLGRNLPFQPLIKGLRQLLNQVGWEHVPAKWSHYLAQLLPELSIQPANGDTFQPGSALHERGQIFEAIYWLLHSLCQGKRALIFLDDAQWADETTLACLTYLGEKLFYRNHGCLVLAARQGEHNTALETFYHLHRRLPTFFEVKLDLLNSSEISELTHYVLGKHPEEALVSQLVQDTGGNPLFLLETLRSLLSTPGSMQGAPGGPLPLAGSIASLVRERLRDISPRARQVLETAAIAGSQFEINLLELASPFTQEKIAHALDELENRDFIKTTPSLPGETLSYTFIHEKIRECLLLDISSARRRLIRLRLAKAIEGQSGNRVSQKAAMVAAYYESAGEPHLAYTWWQHAAVYARQLFSFTEAEAAYQKAEHLIHTLGTVLSDQEIKQLYTAWGQMAYETPRIDIKTRIYSTLMHIGETRHSPLLIGTAHNHLSTACWLSNQMEAGRVHSEKALAYLAQADDIQELAEAHNRYGSLLISINQFDKAVRVLERVLVMAKEHAGLNLTEACFTALRQIGRAWLMMGWPNKAAQYSEQALKDYPTVTHPFAVASVLAVLSVANTFNGNLLQAWDQVQRALELAEKIQNWRFQAYFHLGRSQINFERGWLDECSQDLQRVFDLIKDQPGTEDILASACRNMSDLYLILGDVQMGLTWLEKGLVGDPNSFYYLDNLWRVGQIAGITGNLEQGRATLAKALQASLDQQLGLVAVPAQVASVNLELNGGGGGNLLPERLDQLGQEMAQRGYKLLFNTTGWLSGEIALQKGEFELAMDHANRILRDAESNQHPWMLIRGYYLLDRAHLRHTGKHHPGAYQAMTAVLERLGEHAHQEDMRSIFEPYQKTVLLMMS